MILKIIPKIIQLSQYILSPSLSGKAKSYYSLNVKECYTLKTEK
jgi:hypothetical protein